MASVEKSVKGATKLKLAPPKAKYISHILQTTRTGEQGVAEVFRTLQFRLRDSTWTIAFKALIVVHMMIREGEQGVTLSYISTSPRKLVGVSQYTDGQWREVSYKPGPPWVQTQGRNIRHYSVYLIKRAEAYQKARCDYVEEGAGRLQKLSIDKGLLRETEAVQTVLMALLKCDFMTDEMENEISTTAFRMIVMDLRPLFTVMNEGTMNVLEHYFEMSRPDAERALEIYKSFTRITDQVIKFLNIARQFEHVTKVDTPKLKHAPTSLTSALEEYLNAPDFESNRRQYLADKGDKRGGKTSAGPSRAATSTPAKSGASTNVTRSATTGAVSSQPAQAAKAAGPSTDLIDFFDSIEQNQQPMGTQPTNNLQGQPAFGNAPAQFQQQPMFAPQQTGFAQQTGFDGMQNGFGQQQGSLNQGGMQQNGGFVSQQTGTNPFGMAPQQQQPQPTGNPFNTFAPTQQPQQTGNPFGNFQQQQQPPQQQPQFSQPSQPQQLQPQFTGAGFGGYTPQPPATQGQFTQEPQQMQQPQQSQFTGALQRQPTNPFRQSMLPNRTGSNSSPFGQTMTSNSPFGMTQSIPEDGPMQTISPQSFSNGQNSPFAPSQDQSQASQIMPQRTGTNPFARQQQNSSPAPLQPQTTGTNPFRQSTFVNQTTGQGWQHGNQGTFGGFNTQAIDTTPVFPRPAGQQLGYGQQQQQGFG